MTGGRERGFVCCIVVFVDNRSIDHETSPDPGLDRILFGFLKTERLNIVPSCRSQSKRGPSSRSAQLNHKENMSPTEDVGKYAGKQQLQHMNTRGREPNDDTKQLCY